VEQCGAADRRNICGLDPGMPMIGSYNFAQTVIAGLVPIKLKQSKLS
jgi:hypothetical protein